MANLNPVWSVIILASTAFLGAVKDIPKVILFRALHSLFRKGLVKVGVAPSKGRRVWYKPLDEDKSPGFYGFMSHSERYVSVTVLDTEGYVPMTRTELKSDLGYSQLPMFTRKWWMLTEKGKELVAGQT